MLCPVPISRVKIHDLFWAPRQEINRAATIPLIYRQCQETGRIDALKLTFDLLVELDLTARPSYNREKFLAYDAFLCGWSLAHPRYKAQGKVASRSCRRRKGVGLRSATRTACRLRSRYSVIRGLRAIATSSSKRASAA